MNVTTKTLDQITAGFWWARDRRDGKLTIIEVDRRNERHGLEPDDDDYGVLYGVVMGRDYEDKVNDGGWSMTCYYDFLERIPEPK